MSRKGIYRYDSGFTLIEVLIVMLLIGILGSVSGYAFLMHERNARDREAQAQLLSAHTILMSAYDKGHDHETDVSKEIARLEAKEPTLKGYGVTGQNISEVLDSQPKRIWVSVPDSQNLVLCNQSITGRAYCIRTDTEGIRVQTPSDQNMWAREVRSNHKNVPAEALTNITKNPVIQTDTGWGASHRDGAELSKEYVVPTIRLNCDLIEGLGKNCPSTQTSADSAYFEWTVSEGIAAATGNTEKNIPGIRCQINGHSLTSSADEWSNQAECESILSYPGAPSLKNKAALTAQPENYDDLNEAEKAQASVGRHELVIQATNPAGVSETTYEWLVIPDIPVITITSSSPANFLNPCGTGNNPASHLNDCYAPANMRETGARSIILDWDATITTASPSGSIEKIYCKLELAKPDGTYYSPSGWAGNTECADLLTPDDRVTYNAARREASGVINLPNDLPVGWEQPWLAQGSNLSSSTLPYQNQVPHRLSVIAVNQTGASTTRRFDWRVVDHTRPGYTVPEADPTMVVTRTTSAENILVTGSSGSGWNVCYSPFETASGQIASRSARFDMSVYTGLDQESGNDSGLYDVVYPGIDSAYLGSNGIHTADVTAHTLGNLRYYHNGSTLVATYTFGTEGFNVSSPAELIESPWYVARVYNGAPPSYPHVLVPNIKLKRATQPQTPGFSGGTTDSTAPGGGGWTNAGSVAFTISPAGVFPPGACNELAGYEYEYSFNGGAANIVSVSTAGSFSVSNEGYYAIRVRAVDNFGAVSAWSSLRYAKMDRTAPTVPVNEISGTLSGSGQQPPAVSDAAERWTFNSRRLRGTSSVDNHPLGGANNTYVSSLLSYSCSSAGGRYCPSLSGDFTVSGQGTYTSCFIATDRAGNPSNCSADRTARIDTTAPISPSLSRSPASNDSVGGWHNAAQTMDASGSTDTGGSGFWQYEYSGTCNTAATAEGTFTCVVTARDHAGNSSASSGLLRKDVTAPVISFPAAGAAGGGTGGVNWTNNATVATVSPIISDSGGSGHSWTDCEREYLSGSNGIARTPGTACGNAVNGRSTVRFWAGDAAGNATGPTGRVTQFDNVLPNHNTSGIYIYRTKTTMSDGTTLAWAYHAEPNFLAGKSAPEDPVPSGVNAVSGIGLATLTDCGYDAGAADEQNTNNCKLPHSIAPTNGTAYGWSTGTNGLVLLCNSGCGNQTRAVSLAPRTGASPDTNEGAGSIADGAGNLSDPPACQKFEVDGNNPAAPVSTTTSAKILVKTLAWSGSC